MIQFYKEIKMKLLFALLTSLALVGTAYAGGETKEVCKDKLDKAGKPIVDKKTGKTAQDCKKIKVHKKLEGTEVPTKK
jgi:hypothetical protein